jgi:hypothetical protein
MANERKTIIDFLTDLVQNPELLQAYLTDPDSVMGEYGLAEDQIAILNGDDLRVMWDQVYEDYAALAPTPPRPGQVISAHLIQVIAAAEPEEPEAS